MSSILLLLSLDFSLDISAEYGGWSLDWGLELWRRELWEVEGGALGQQPLPDEPALENPSKSPTPTLQLGQISSKKISCKKVRNTHPPQVCSLVHALTLLKYCAISFLAGHIARKICHLQDRHYVMSFHFFWPQEKILFCIVLCGIAWNCLALHGTGRYFTVLSCGVVLILQKWSWVTGVTLVLGRMKI